MNENNVILLKINNMVKEYDYLISSLGNNNEEEIRDIINDLKDNLHNLKILVQKVNNISDSDKIIIENIFDIFKKYEI